MKDSSPDRRRLRGSQSTVLKREPVSDRPAYKNYLADVKVKTKKPENEVEDIKKAKVGVREVKEIKVKA